MEHTDFTFRKAWMIYTVYVLLLFTPTAKAQQTARLVSLELKNEKLSAALKQIEKTGGKNTLFAYEETENYHVTASIRKQTQGEAIRTVLKGKPFNCIERTDYFVIQRKGKDGKTTQVRGTIYGDRNEPLAYANVILLAAADSAFITGCVTAEDGSFILPGNNERNHLLKVTYIGYQSLTLPCQPENDIHLQPDAQMLKEVTVTASRPLVERKNGAFVANVAGTPLSMLGSASDMIGHLPFVTGSDGNYTVIGRGKPEIYINGRKVRDTSELNQLQANEILSAEIVTTPGARYSSSVSSVIRLRTIRKRGQGLSANAYADYTQGHSAKGKQGASLNYRTGGLDIFVKGHFNESDTYSTSHTQLQLNTSSEWKSFSDNVNRAHDANFNGEVGFNYEPDDHQSFGIRYMPQSGLGNTELRSQGETVMTKDGKEVDRLTSYSHSRRQPHWTHSMNGYYNGTFGKWNIDFNADYLNGRSAGGQKVDNNGETDATSSSEVKNRLYAAKLIITAPLWQGKFSFGTEETFTERHDIFKQSGFSNDADNRIKQSVVSTFADYSIELGKFSLMAGLRYECQKTDYYESDVYKEEKSPVYHDLIPVAGIFYKEKDWSINLAYRMTKYNPGYRMLNSSIGYQSKYQYSNGNPELKPQKQSLFSLDSGWKWINASIHFVHVQETYITYAKPYDDVKHPGVVLWTNANVPDSYAYGGAIVLSPQFKWWRPQLMGSISWFHSNARSLNIQQLYNEPLMQFSLDNSFTLPREWFLNVQGRLSSDAKQSFGVRKTEGRVDAQLTKSFLKDHSLRVSLVANDIFRTGKYHFYVYGDRTYNEFEQYADNQRFGIRLNYLFNATKNKYKGKGAGESEKRRL